MHNICMNCVKIILNVQWQMFYLASESNLNIDRKLLELNHLRPNQPWQKLNLTGDSAQKWTQNSWISNSNIYAWKIELLIYLVLDKNQKIVLWHEQTLV